MAGFKVLGKLAQKIDEGYWGVKANLMKRYADYYYNANKISPEEIKFRKSVVEQNKKSDQEYRLKEYIKNKAKNKKPDSGKMKGVDTILQRKA